jgi:Enoyl-(Acyl carrier protein) reductase
MTMRSTRVAHSFTAVMMHHYTTAGAAGNFLANAHELSLKGFKTVLDIDTVGVFNMSTTAYPALAAAAAATTAAAPTSVIINISMTLHYGATHFQVHSSAAKAAIDSLTRSFALEWGPKRIRVVGLAPGPIADTPGMAKLRCVHYLCSFLRCNCSSICVGAAGVTRSNYIALTAALRRLHYCKRVLECYCSSACGGLQLLRFSEYIMLTAACSIGQVLRYI